MSPPQQTTSDAPTLQHTGKLRRALPRMSPLHVRESPRSALQGCSPAPPLRCTLRPGSTTLLLSAASAAAALDSTTPWIVVSIFEDSRLQTTPIGS